MLLTDTLLVAGGSLGIFVSFVHGFIGETKVARLATHPQISSKRVIHALIFLSAVYWFLGGTLIVAAPFLLDKSATLLSAIIVCTMYGTGAAGNFWATKGNHIGWVLLAIATALIALGMLL